MGTSADAAVCDGYQFPILPFRRPITAILRPFACMSRAALCGNGHRSVSRSSCCSGKVLHWIGKTDCVSPRKRQALTAVARIFSGAAATGMARPYRIGPEIPAEKRHAISSPRCPRDQFLQLDIAHTNGRFQEWPDAARRGNLSAGQGARPPLCLGAPRPWPRRPRAWEATRQDDLSGTQLLK
jgi:hypothetical protein